MITFLQGALDGVLIGGVYAVIAIGLTLLFGVVKIVNFAHGAMVMAAAYTAFVLYRNLGIDPYLAIPIVALLFFSLGVGYYLVFLRRLVDASLLGQALFTIGIALVITNVSLAVFGPSTQTFDLPYGLATLRLGELIFEWTRIAAFGAALVTTTILYLLLWRSDFGVQVRASASDRRTAELVGINTTRVQAIATGLSLALAAIAGCVLLPILFVSPLTGDQYIFLAFVIIVLGGLGNFFGALAGGVLIGVTQSLGSTYFDGSMSQLFTFVLFILVLIFRPRGLFSGKERSAA